MKATERQTNDERPTPKEEARKTTAEGKEQRTKLSKPRAHPTETEAPAGTEEKRTEIALQPAILATATFSKPWLLTD